MGASHEEHHDCRHFLASLSDYVDGLLDDALCREIEAHMAGCENCRIVINTLSKTVELYHTAPVQELPQDVQQRLFASLDLEKFLRKQG